MTASVWHRNGPMPPKPRHVVASVPFRLRFPANDTPIECRCGWSGTVREWEAEHGGRVSRAWDEEGRFPKKVVVPVAVDACRRGHERNAENTYFYSDRRGFRVRACRPCHRESNNAYMARKRAA